MPIGYSTIHRDPRLDVIDHLHTTVLWLQQLSHQITTSSDKSERARLHQAVQCVHQLRHLCFSFQTLLETRDALTPGMSLSPIPRNLQARPSVQTQLQHIPHLMTTSHSSNFYSILEDPDDSPLEVSSPSLWFTRMTRTPTTVHATTIDDLISEFTSKDIPADRPQPAHPDVAASVRPRSKTRTGLFIITAITKDKNADASPLLKSPLSHSPSWKEGPNRPFPMFNSSDILMDIKQLTNSSWLQMYMTTPSSVFCGQLHTVDTLLVATLFGQRTPFPLTRTFELTRPLCHLNDNNLMGPCPQRSAIFYDMVPSRTLQNDNERNSLWHHRHERPYSTTVNEQVETPRKHLKFKVEGGLCSGTTCGTIEIQVVYLTMLTLGLAFREVHGRNFDFCLFVNYFLGVALGWLPQPAASLWDV